MLEPRSYITISAYPRHEYTFDPLEERPDIPDQLVLESIPDEPVFYIVQFQQPLTAEQKAQLQERYQLRFNEYIPTNAFVEWLRPEQLATLSQEPAFRAGVVYQPAFKISPAIGQVEFRTLERREVKGLWLEAVLAEEADPHQVTELLSEVVNASQIDVLDDREFGGRLRVRFVVPSEESLPDIARLKEVRWIEEVPEFIEDNGITAGTIQSGTLGTVPIWDQGIHGEGQIIGVIESRLADINHCWFRDNTNNTPRPAHRKVVGLHFSLPDVIPRSHATRVCGIAVGDDVNNPAAAPNRGMAWAARITFATRSGSLLSKLMAAATDGAFIHTNSWHQETADALQPARYTQTAADVDTFTWLHEGSLVLGSSGNIGEEQGPPGTAKNAICVSATMRDDRFFCDGMPGPTADGRRKPDLCAPGSNVTSATVDTDCGTDTGGGCASSWATPAVAGAAALVRQYYTEGFYPRGTRQPQCGFTPTGALLKATLLNSTVDMPRVPGYPSNQEGWGRIRLNNTLVFPGSARGLRVWDTFNSSGLEFRETRQHEVNVAHNTQALKITLVWTEPPGAAGATTPKVNDLNLVALSPSFLQTFLGNNFAGGTSAPGTIGTGANADSINNVEMVLIRNPAPGTWRIQVTGAQVNVGKQGYALVVSADLTQPDVKSPMTPFIRFTPAGDLDFGEVVFFPFGSASRSINLTVTNMGPDVATVTFPPLPPPPQEQSFSWDVGSFVIPSCSRKTVSVTFSPKHLGSSRVVLKVTSNAPGSPHSIRLSGMGMPAPLPPH